MKPLTRQATCQLPVKGGLLELQVYGDGDDGKEDLLLGVHKTTTDPTAVPLVRLHSACATGDILGSLRCDCGPQLNASLEHIFSSEYGVLVYLLNHEGRGIGLANKLKAYALQESGLNTAEANVALGFPEDDRKYYNAANVLLQNGMAHIRLATNNPTKVAALEKSGVTVVERVHLGGFVSPHNAEYLHTKDSIMGHLGSAASSPPAFIAEDVSRKTGQAS